MVSCQFVKCNVYVCRHRHVRMFRVVAVILKTHTHTHTQLVTIRAKVPLALFYFVHSIWLWLEFWLNSMVIWNKNNLSTRAHNTQYSNNNNSPYEKACNQDYCYLFLKSFHFFFFTSLPPASLLYCPDCDKIQVADLCWLLCTLILDCVFVIPFLTLSLSIFSSEHWVVGSLE